MEDKKSEWVNELNRKLDEQRAAHDAKVSNLEADTQKALTAENALLLNNVNQLDSEKAATLEKFVSKILWSSFYWSDPLQFALLLVTYPFLQINELQQVKTDHSIQSLHDR